MQKLNKIGLSDIEDKLKAFQSVGAEPTKKFFPDDRILDSDIFKAAAVSIFYEPEEFSNLAGFGDQESKDLINELIGYSEMVLNYGNEMHFNPNTASEGINKVDQRICFMMRDDVRKVVLKRMIEAGTLEDVMTSNKGIVLDSEILLQRIFTQCLENRVPNINTMNLQELNALLRVSEWFDESTFPLPSRKVILRTIEMFEMLAPFKHLNGQYMNGSFVEQFRGRKNELALLRKYVGVIEPQGTMEVIQRYYQSYIEPVINWDKKPPLLIFGLGGVGKSTLLAKFLLDHVQAHTIDRFPFVYLDFDRQSLNANEPETLLIESSRQLSVQYGDVDELAVLFSNFHTKWKDVPLGSTKEKSTKSIRINADADSQNIRHARENMVNEFVMLLERLSKIEKKPFLIVLDTFEEVQYKGIECVRQLYDFMQQFQAKYPLLRVVVAGRAPVTGIKTQEMELGDLDPEAATSFLEKLGITEVDEVKVILSKVKGNPLALKLAAELIKSSGKEELEQLTLSKKKFMIFEGRLPAIEIQGILYRRILAHVHNPNVRKLAHPGLVLRKITADLILNVLAKPCNLDIETIDEAEELFAEMSKEVSLIIQVDSSTIRHRSDLRKVMLTLIKEDNPSVVKEIHERAANYYQNMEGVAARAEEFYHRLSLNESPRILDSRWIDGIQNYLLGSMDELPPKAQTFLSGRTGVEVSDISMWENADIEDVERHMVRNVADLLNSGQPEKVLELMDQVGDSGTKSGVLSLFKVRALLQMKRLDEAKHTASVVLNSFYADELNPRIKSELYNLSQSIDQMEADESSVQLKEQENLDEDQINSSEGRNKMEGDGAGSFEYSL